MTTQKNQPHAADLAERGLSLAAGAAFVIDALARRNWSSLITAPLGAVLLAHGSTRAPLLDRVLPSSWSRQAQQTVKSQVAKQQTAKNLAVTQAVTVNRSADDLYDLLAQL